MGTRTDARFETLEKAIADQTARLTAIETRFNELDAKAERQAADHRAQFDQLVQLITRGPQMTPGSSSSNSSGAPNNSNIPIATPLAIQQTMELPTFDGSDALSWLSRADQYFLVHNTPQDQRVQVALIALAGPAMAWFQLLLRRRPLLTWKQFAQELMGRFGTNAALDGYEALRTTTQEGTLDDYIEAFEARLTQLSDVPEIHYIGYFLGGLKPHLRLQIKDPAITSYFAAVQMAKRVDLLSSGSRSGQNVSKQIWQASTTRPPSGGQHAHSFHGATGTAQEGGRKPPRFRNMTSEEVRKHIAAGTCFRCGLRFGPNHQCPPKTLQVLIMEENTELNEMFYEVGDTHQWTASHTILEVVVYQFLSFSLVDKAIFTGGAIDTHYKAVRDLSQ